MKEEFFELIAELGGWGLIITAIAAGLYKLLLQRLQKRYDSEIEDLKSKNSYNNTLINNLTNSIPNVYLSSNEKRIEYLEGVWLALVEIKEQFPSAISLIYTILTKEEVEEINNSGKELIKQQLKSTHIDPYLELTNSLHNKINLSRPFIGSELWLIFFVYRAFHARIAFKTIENFNQENLKHWTSDREFLDSVLTTVIPKNHLEKLLEKNFSGFSNIRDYLETKALNNIGEQLTGKHISKENLNQAIKLSKLSTFLNKDKSKNNITPPL